jgi:hypothetical protein
MGQMAGRAGRRNPGRVIATQPARRLNTGLRGAAGRHASTEPDSEARFDGAVDSFYSLWRFEASGTDLGTKWRATGFNESARLAATTPPLSHWPLTVTRSRAERMGLVGQWRLRLIARVTPLAPFVYWHALSTFRWPAVED